MKRTLHFLGIHDWDKWTQYDQKMVNYGRILHLTKRGVKYFEYIEERQKRFCRICNKMEVEVV